MAPRSSGDAGGGSWAGVGQKKNKFQWNLTLENPVDGSASLFFSSTFRTNEKMATHDYTICRGCMLAICCCHKTVFVCGTYNGSSKCKWRFCETSNATICIPLLFLSSALGPSPGAAGLVCTHQASASSQPSAFGRGSRCIFLRFEPWLQLLSDSQSGGRKFPM